MRPVLPILLCLVLHARSVSAEVGLRDIRGPVLIDSQPPFLYVGAALLLIIALWLLLTRRKAGGVALPVARMPAALCDPLAQLAAQYHQGACSSDEVILQLDHLLRSAIEEHRAIPAQQLTSSELQALFISRSAATLLMPPSLAKLLPLFDRVKFASRPADGQEIEWALATTAELIDALRAGAQE